MRHQKQLPFGGKGFHLSSFIYDNVIRPQHPKDFPLLSAARNLSQKHNWREAASGLGGILLHRDFGLFLLRNK